jgi:tRNA-2-methylthio-N6-dimethylallyladenosine synthase
MNERDSAAVAELLRSRGYSIVSDEFEADTILLNTCSVRDQAEQKAIGKAGYLRKRKVKNPNFLLGIMGCMAQNHLIQSMQGQGPKPSTIVDLDEEEASQNEIRHHNTATRQVSAFVSIMQGCNMRCSFCIVPKTRGEERARPMADIVEEVASLAESGTREVTLLGQIVTSYGQREFPKVDGKTPFVQLLEKINALDGIQRIRFTSPHPRGFREDLVQAYRDLPKLCEYVHLPLQSGSDAILKRMKRPYTVERYREIVASLRKAAPDMYFSTDVIVGFPGETEEDFEATRRLFEDLRFDMAYIFKYSPRSGTPAAEMEDQVPLEEKERRNQVLLEILGRHSLARNETLIGKTVEILVEGPARKGNGMYVGRTRGFRKVIFSGKERQIGELIQVEIHTATVSTLFGEAAIIGVEDHHTLVNT